MKKDFADRMKKAEKYCLRLIAIRSRSEYEINKSLENKGYSRECRSELVRKLKEKKLIDDSVFATDWIISRMRFNPRSRLLLKQELMAKGINEDLIDKTLGESAEILDDIKLSIRIAQEQNARIAEMSKEKKKMKIYRMLISRGFDEEIARETVESVLSD